LNKSAIARVKRIAWNTVDRWLQKAAYSCRRFNDQKIDGIAISELQADEIRTIIHDKEQPIWIFAAIEVWSRLWPSTVVGRRSYRNTLTLFRDISSRTCSSNCHGRICFLCESYPPCLWTSVFVRPSH
jgi:hypothetical protein